MPILLVTTKVYVVVVVGFTVYAVFDIIDWFSTVAPPLIVTLVALVNTGISVVEPFRLILALVVVIEAVGFGI